MFCCCYLISFSVFLLPNLPGDLVDRFQTLQRVRWLPESIKFSQKFGFMPPENCAGLKHKISTFWLDDCKYLRNATRYRQMENGVAHCDLSHMLAYCLMWWTLVYKWQEVGPKFWPTQWAAIMLGLATHCGYKSEWLPWMVSDAMSELWSVCSTSDFVCSVPVVHFCHCNSVSLIL